MSLAPDREQQQRASDAVNPAQATRTRSCRQRSRRCAPSSTAKFKPVSRSGLQCDNLTRHAQLASERGPIFAGASLRGL